jgi:hypothetical protein
MAAWSFVLFQAAAFPRQVWDTFPVNVNDDLPSSSAGRPRWLAVLGCCDRDERHCQRG